MKNTLLKGFIALTAILCFLTSDAQKVDVEWGPIQKDSKTSYLSSIIGNDENGYYVLRTRGGGLFSSLKYFVERHNNDHSVEFNTEIVLQNKQKKDCIMEDLIMTPSGFLLFMTYYDSKADKNICYAQTFDKDAKATSGVEQVDYIVSKKKSNIGSFIVRTSEDGSRILVAHQEAYDKKKNEKFSYKVFDNSLKQLWEKDIELPYKDKAVTISNYKVDNKGFVYALESVESELKGSGLFSKTKKIYSYKIVTYNYKKDKVDEIPLSLGGAKFITDVTFALDEKKEKLLVTGFYTNKERNGGIAGTLFIRIDKNTFKTEFDHAAAFDKKFLAEVLRNTASEKKAKKAESISTMFDLDHIIIKEDGGIMLVAEEYYVHVVTRTASNGTTTTTYYYYYRNILAININPDGTIKWGTVIPKTQVSVNDGGRYSSYIVTYHNDKLYLFYNDNPKNTSAKTKAEDRGKYQMNKPKKAIVVMSVVDQNGHLSQEAFFKSKNDAKSILKPKMYARFRPDNILVYSEYGAKYKFGTFKVSE